MKKQESETIIKEHGVYKRTLYRKGRKRRQRTQRLKKNPEKVVIGKIGELEVYVYPYNFPDKVFLGQYPNFTMTLTKQDIPKLFCIYNISRWYFNGEWQNEPKKSKPAKRLRKLLILAYKTGLDKLKKTKKR